MLKMSEERRSLIAAAFVYKILHFNIREQSYTDVDGWNKRNKRNQFLFSGPRNGLRYLVVGWEKECKSTHFLKSQIY